MPLTQATVVYPDYGEMADHRRAVRLNKVISSIGNPLKSSIFSVRFSVSLTQPDYSRLLFLPQRHAARLIVNQKRR